MYTAGKFLGYAGLLEESKYSESAIVWEVAQIAQIPKENFFNLWMRPTKFIEMFSNYLKEQLERLLKLAYNGVCNRVANTLLMLCKKYKHKDIRRFSLTIFR